MFDYLRIAIRAALDSGVIALNKQFDELNVKNKNDSSPVSDSDFEINRQILNILKPTDLPVLSEEQKIEDFSTRKKWPLFWMVDPLDGTKAYIKGEKEFTVNLALIRKDTPVLGVVFAPATAELWYGVLNAGAWKLLVKDGKESINELFKHSQSLPLYNKKSKIIIVTRSHMNYKTEAFIEKAKIDYPDAEIKQEGSSMKFCRVAEGSADIHLRAGAVKEWDTAAGDAVLRATGGKVLDDKNGNPLLYNKLNLEIEKIWAERD